MQLHHHARVKTIHLGVPPTLHRIPLLAVHERRRSAAARALAEQRHRDAERQALTRMRREFAAWPTLRLTTGQARRLLGVSDAVCETVFQSLIRAGFLCRTSDGQYRRPDALD